MFWEGGVPGASAIIEDAAGGLVPRPGQSLRSGNCHKSGRVLAREVEGGRLLPSCAERVKDQEHLQMRVVEEERLKREWEDRRKEELVSRREEQVRSCGGARLLTMLAVGVLCMPCVASVSVR